MSDDQDHRAVLLQLRELAGQVPREEARRHLEPVQRRDRDQVEDAEDDAEEDDRAEEQADVLVSGEAAVGKEV